jgi:hypothetical protein
VQRPGSAHRRRQQKIQVEAVGLGALAAPLHGDAGGVHDVDFEPALLQGAGNPESVSAGFETDNDPRDLKTRLITTVSMLRASKHRFVCRDGPAAPTANSCRSAREPLQSS